jgi:hypothetical protein
MEDFRTEAIFALQQICCYANRVTCVGDGTKYNWILSPRHHVGPVYAKKLMERAVHILDLIDAKRPVI